MHYKHGKTGTRIYRIWREMIKRCTDKTNKRYEDYGGRGIKIYHEWFDFEKFLKWATASGYSDNLSLDRIDNNEGYSPFNCKWSTRVEQQNNTRRNRYVTFNGETHTVAEWERITGIRINTIITRLNRGWSASKALTTLSRR